MKLYTQVYEYKYDMYRLHTQGDDFCNLDVGGQHNARLRWGGVPSLRFSERTLQHLLEALSRRSAGQWADALLVLKTHQPD